jgi:hypothetical protein
MQLPFLIGLAYDITKNDMCIMNLKTFYFNSYNLREYGFNLLWDLHMSKIDTEGKKHDSIILMRTQSKLSYSKRKKELELY